LGKIKQHIYLIAALVFIALMLTLKQFFFNSTNVTSYVEQIKENLKIVSEDADNDIFYVKKKLKEANKIHFGNFLEENKYPIFIFKNKKLVYWSDHTYYLNYYDLIGYYDEKCIETKRGIFIAKKSMIMLDNQDYEIVALIPIRRRYQVDNEFLRPTLNPDIFPGQRVRVSTSKGNMIDIYNNYKTYLFSVTFPEDFSYHSEQRWIMVVLMGIVVLLLLLQLREYLQTLLRNGQTLRATLLLSFGLVFIRAIMLYYQIPYDYLEYELFEPQVFASSLINPSLGDLFINSLCILVIVLFFYANYPKIIRYKKILSFPRWAKALISVSAVVLSYFVVFGIFQVLKTIYDNSLISLDITQGIAFPIIKIVCLLIFVCLAVGYFFTAHIFAKLLIKLSNNSYDLPVRFVIGSLVFYLTSLSFGFENITLFNVNAIYILFVSFLDLPISLKRSDYSTYIYLFVCAVVVSTVGAYSIFRFEENRTIGNKYKYANTLLIENDLLGEYYLNEMTKKAQKDISIQNKFKDGSAASMEWVEKKMRRMYFNPYFDKYNINILLFDKNQKPYNSRRYYNIEFASKNKTQYRTEYDNIYFINDVARGTKSYEVFIPISKEYNRLGYILMKLDLRKVIPNSIYPNFFVDKKYQVSNEASDYSYGIYAKNSLLFSSGEFTYDNNLLKEFEHNMGFLKDEVQTKGFHHLRVANNNDQQIIISSPIYPNNQILTNFSFLFLLLVFVLLLIISGYNFYVRQSKASSQAKKLNFNTKIQLYLNFAFFVPLIVVSIIVVSILNSSNIQETKTYYLEKAENIANDLMGQVQEFYNGSLEKSELQNYISEIADITQSDVNLFDRNGQLIVPSQNYIYENQLMNSVVNPHAYAQLIEENQSKAMFDESIGMLNFNSAYVSVKSLENGEVLGIVGIPFFGSKQRYEKQVIDVLSKIMQAFAFILIGLLAISYFSARTLTAPLRLIRQKIRKVSFQENNEPIDYVSDDEIGLLVSEYNKMLVTLEESKQALSKKEKESAWREMAKQVAHEIKNPLTPMKLNIQQLERLLGDGEERTKRTIRTLLNQIDTLSEIATSFSNFAEMPTPKEEVFDVATALRQVVHLHDNPKKVKLIAEIPDAKVAVLGDKQLLGRVFNNLIINGIQSIPTERSPEVRVRLDEREKSVVIRISDNGSGIPEDIQTRVFVPNFTTKTSGSGIGLAISKRAIEHLGGKIWFETEIDKGTTFYVEMPLLD
jgi:two-component system nitrogen regulation sensor histidine kinase NtrY